MAQTRHEKLVVPLLHFVLIALWIAIYNRAQKEKH
jgi:hypothetical protein